MSRARLNNKGVSLVEAIVASLILAIGSLLLLTGFLSVGRLMDNSSRLDQHGQSTMGWVNGAPDSSTNYEETPANDITMSIGGQQFVIEGGKIKKYTHSEDEDVFLYRFMTN